MQLKIGVPVPMRKNEINRILGKVDDMALADESVNIPFVVGETVKVIDGPFNSFHAEIEAIDEQKKKLQLMVKIFGRKTFRIKFYASRKNIIWQKKLQDLLSYKLEEVQLILRRLLVLRLGAKGVNIMEFCKQFNARTQDKAGTLFLLL